MKVTSINNFNRGWFIGDFEKSLTKTKEFEVGLIPCSKGIHQKHHHKIAREFNVIVNGSVKINNIVLKEGDIYIVEPNESIEQEFIEDSLILCVKTPSIVGDKYLE